MATVLDALARPAIIYAANQAQSRNGIASEREASETANKEPTTEIWSICSSVDMFVSEDDWTELGANG
jgi:hypothetical protein